MTDEDRIRVTVDGKLTFWVTQEELDRADVFREILHAEVRRMTEDLKSRAERKDDQ